jgi:hypothetical protein
VNGLPFMTQNHHFRLRFLEKWRIKNSNMAIIAQPLEKLKLAIRQRLLWHKLHRRVRPRANLGVQGEGDWRA